MRYILLGLLLLGLMGCGSNNRSQDNNEELSPPASPNPTNQSKQPPSIPNLQ